MNDETTRNDRVLAAVRAAIEMANVSDDDVAEFRERWLRPHLPVTEELTIPYTEITLAVDGVPLYRTALAQGNAVSSQVSSTALDAPLRFTISCPFTGGVTINIKERT